MRSVNYIVQALILLNLGEYDYEREHLKLDAQELSWKEIRRLQEGPSTSDDSNIALACDIQLLLCASLNTRSLHFTRQDDHCYIHHVPNTTTSIFLSVLGTLFAKPM